VLEQKPGNKGVVEAEVGIGRLKGRFCTKNARVLEGDVLDSQTLEAAMAGQDIVYANLAGELEQQAQCIVKTMQKAGIKRLIFISSMGTYDEIPGEHHGMHS
jgi:putative NADH-flavin reductase